MCTLSYLSDPQGLTLFFNRDERHTRAKETAPRLWESGNYNFLAPEDPDSGGTWLGVNAAGLVVCILNQYPVIESGVEISPNLPGSPSRGVLVRETLGNCGNLEAAESFILSLAQTYPPFSCLVLQIGAPGRLIVRQVRRPAFSEEFAGLPPITTSSFSPEVVREHRLRTFRKMVDPEQPDESDLFAFHASHDLENGAASVMMRRSDAETRSIIRLRVTRTTAVMRHHRKIRGTFELEAPTESILPLLHQS